MRSFYIGLSIFVAAVCVGIVIWSLQPPPKSPGQKFIEAKYVRPGEIDTDLAEGLIIRIGETDWTSQTPEIECGSKHMITATIPNLNINDDVWKKVLRIVPRLPGSTPEAFSWHQFGIDRNIPLEDSHPEPKSINVAAGEYRVRFYLVLEPEDHESGRMPIVHYLAERRLIVTPAPGGGDCGKIPSKDSQGSFPVKPG